MKLGLDPRLPIQGGQDYSKQLYTRLYDIFRSHAAAVNAVNAAADAAQETANSADAKATQALATTGALGTAASKDITTSPTDTTSGHLLKVGDGGFLGVSVPLPAPGTDLATLAYASGVTYTLTGTIANSPLSGSAGILEVANRQFPGASGITLTATYTSSSQLRVFKCQVVATAASGLYTPSGPLTWFELYHSGNLRFADNATALARASSTTLLSPASLGFAEHPVKTASVQFVRATNEILMSGIVTDLDLEVGDVIQITGSASNNLTVTVEVITDDNDINVNYAHRNGAGPLSLTDETAANVTIKRLAKWFAAPLCLGQEWVFLTAADRVANTAYRNTTGRPLMLQRFINTASGSAHVYVSRDGSNWVGVGSAASTYAAPLSFVVSVGWYYKSDFAIDNTLATIWAELR